MSDSSKLTNPHKTFYALPAFVLAFPTIPVFVLLPSYYGDTLGLGLATVGSVLLVLRIFDMISDPLLGWASEHVPPKYGKRKLPIVIGGLIAAPALIMLFSPPDDVTWTYLFFWGLLLYLGWTAIQIPYLAWAVELAPDYEGRTRLNGFREGCGIIGILFIGGLGAALASMDPDESLSLQAWVTVGLGAVVFFLLVKFVPERKHIVQKMKLTFPYKNKLFLRVLTAWFMNGFANGLPAVCLPLYLTYVLGAGEQDRANLLLIYFLFAVMGIPLWLWLAKYFSKHAIWCSSMIIACIAFAFVPFLGQGDLMAFAIICAITGIALGSDLALPPSIQGDCADWDRFKFSKERTATLFSYWSMATKMALGVAVGVAFPTLEYFGFQSDAETISTTTETALIVIYAGIPVVLKLIAIAMMWGFPLSKLRHQAVRRALEKKNA